MVLAHVLQSSPPLPFVPNDLALLFIGTACAFLLSYLCTFGVIFVCKKAGWLDRSTAERKRIHKNPTPRLGGVAMYLAFVIASLIFYVPDRELGSQEFIRYCLLLVGATLIVVVHAIDDIKGLSPRTKLLTQTVAVLILLGPFIDMKFHGILLFGFNNPFPFRAPAHHPGLPWYQEPELTLFIRPPNHQLPSIEWLAIPAALFTWFWMAGMMNTINFIDGVDGLATGVVGIAGIFVALISWNLGQYTIALLSAIFTGAVFGFLPHNWNPAKIFMGDSGSQFLGLLLAALSILGGAKVALALMVLGIPILDLALVAINRLRKGVSPAHHDTTNHLHYRLLSTGLNPKQICYVLYGITAIFGLMALALPRIYKILGIGMVAVVMAGLIIWADYRRRQRDSVKGGSDMPPVTPAPEGIEPGIEEASAAEHGVTPSK